MNTNDFHHQLIKKYGAHYTREDVLLALDGFKPLPLFDMVCESGLHFMMKNIREYVAGWMMAEQKKRTPEIATSQGSSL